MESQNFGHSHPLVYNEGKVDEEQLLGNCGRCGEVVSAAGPRFSCAECKKFWLHKKCADAPSTLHHPFHPNPNHSLTLLPKPPYKGTCSCDFCSENCESFFVYHCSSNCELDFHIKCAFFTLNIAEKNLGELEHIATIDPSISSDSDHGNKLELENAKCFGCWEPLESSVYLSLDCGFKLHKKCGELPHQINHPLHTNHPLVLQFNAQRFSCHLCQQTRYRGFIYCCSPCKFAIHIKCAELPSETNHPCHRKHPLTLKSENLPCKTCNRENRFQEFVYCCLPCKLAFHIECAFPPPVVKHTSHPHSFILILKDSSFICDACGTTENYVAYLCPTCMLIVHKKCISLPRIIKLLWHEHPTFHNYFLSQDNHNDCEFCHDEVNTNYGSYFCSICNYIYHVNCAIENKSWYDVIDPQNKDEKATTQWNPSSDPFIVIERSEGDEATKIRHFSHVHDLMLGDKMLDDKLCDGCVLFISTSFYFCSQCDFFLHKACAELSKERKTVFHGCHQPEILIFEGLFKCANCAYDCSGFAYKCYGCNKSNCIGCRTYTRMTIEGHIHPLLYYHKYKGKCNACGMDTNYNAFRCKTCDFVLHDTCVALTRRVKHKSDKHLLTLTYHDKNDYSESYYCEICEERRNPSHWFYYCAICENSFHIKCVRGKYSFIKPGSIYKEENHPHPLTFIEKIYYYPECLKCGKLCQDLALECTKSGCNYIIHWECRS